MSTQPIVTAGAGIAGLVLGQCLKRRGIPTLILEKAASSSRHNYAITLHPWACRPLLRVLQMDELVFRKRVSVDANQGGIGAIVENPMLSDEGISAGAFRCHCGKLEELLRGGQDIRWEHKIEEIQISSSQITLNIAGQKLIETEVLVGADGVHSQVRKCLAPQIQLKMLPYVVFYGNRTLTPDEYQSKVQPYLHGSSIIQSQDNGIVLQISLNNASSGDVNIGYIYSRPAHQKDPLHNPDRSNAAASEIPEALYEELSDLEELDPAFAEIFNPTKVRQDRVLHWLMRSSLGTEQDYQTLADQGVLLIGDAFHAMPILGGEGANHAMKDGVDLTEHISMHGSESMKDFSKGKYEKWKEGVEQSEQRLTDMHSPPKAFL